MQGNLGSINVIDVLLRLHLEKRSGILRLARDDVKKSIYFLNGSIVFAHSNQKSDRLGETMLRLGKISLEDFEIASREVIEKGKRLGQALSDLGMISAEEVNSSVHYQLQQIIFSVFDWDSGEYEFVERERPVFEDIMVNVSTPELLIDGIRNISNVSVLQRCYQNNEKQVLHLASGNARLPRKDLHYGEETISSCVDGTRTIAAVRQLAHLSRIEFDRALCSLLLCGLVQLQKQEPADRAIEMQVPQVQQRPSFTTRPLPAEESGRFKTLSEEEMRRLVTISFDRLQDATDEEALKVLPNCTPQELDKAYEELKAQFLAPYQSQTRFLDLKDRLGAILERFETAHGNLIQKAFSQMPLEQSVLVFNSSAAKPPVSETKLEQRESEGSPREDSVTRGEPVKEPISELQEKIKKDPSNTTLLRRLGKRFYETGKPHEGEKQLLKALELEPQSVENHFALADFYQSMGLKIKAFKHLNIILQLDPNNARAMELLNLKKARKPLYEINH